MLDDDPLDHVCHVLAGVDGILEKGIQVLPLDDLDRVVAIREERSHRAPRDEVTLVLEPMDLDVMVGYVAIALRRYSA